MLNVIEFAIVIWLCLQFDGAMSILQLHLNIGKNCRQQKQTGEAGADNQHKLPEQVPGHSLLVVAELTKLGWL